MKTVLYLDVLLIVNFLIGYLLVGAAAVWFRLFPPFWARLLSAGVCAVSALSILLPVWPFPAQLLFRAGVGFAVSASAFGWHGVKSLLAQTAVLFAGSVALAGLALLLSVRGGAHTNNLACYFYLPPGLLLGCILAVYLALRLALPVFGRRPQPLGQCALTVCGKTLGLCVFEDTGFLLEDTLGGLPVLLLSLPTVEDRLPPQLAAFLRGWFEGEAVEPPRGAALHLLPCKTALGGGLFPAVTARCGARGEPILAAFCNRKFAVEGADAIRGNDFPTELFRQEDGHGVIRKNGKCNSQAAGSNSAAGCGLLHQRTRNPASAPWAGGGKARV